MLQGYNLIGQTALRKGNQTIQAFSTVKKLASQQFYLATHDEINRAVDKSVSTFQIYKNASPKEKIFFLKTIEHELTGIGDLKNV